jgi:hypothetical protein
MRHIEEGVSSVLLIMMPWKTTEEFRVLGGVGL